VRFLRARDDAGDAGCPDPIRSGAVDHADSWSRRGCPRRKLSRMPRRPAHPASRPNLSPPATRRASPGPIGSKGCGPSGYAPTNPKVHL
jgi:hypothetical protein